MRSITISQQSADNEKSSTFQLLADCWPMVMDHGLVQSRIFLPQRRASLGTKTPFLMRISDPNYIR